LILTRKNKGQAAQRWRVPVLRTIAAFTISPGTGMVAANFACSRPTERVLRNVTLKNFDFIGIEAKRKPGVITAWTTPFDEVRIAPGWSPQIEQVPDPFEHLPPRLLLLK
jgi:hypothetical protein